MASTLPPHQVDETTARRIYEDNVCYFEGCARLYDLSNPAEWNLFERSLLRHDLRLMARLLAGRAPVQVLDVGAGTGRLAVPYARRGWQVLALDLSEAMLQMCQGKSRRRGLQDRLALLCCDAVAFLATCPVQYDLITFSSVLHHLPDYLGAVARACELLRPGGLLYITHEPELRTTRCDSLGMQVLQNVDRALRIGQQLCKHLPRMIHHWPKPPTYPHTDYHFERGCDLSALREVIAASGLQERHLRHYKPRNTALIGWLDSQVFRTPNWHFRLLAQKSGPEA